MPLALFVPYEVEVFDRSRCFLDIFLKLLALFLFFDLSNVFFRFFVQFLRTRIITNPRLSAGRKPREWVSSLMAFSQSLEALAFFMALK